MSRKTAFQTKMLYQERESAALTRRDFVEMAGAMLALAGSHPNAWGVNSRGDVPYRTLGETGEKVSIVGIGGYHLGRPADPQDLFHEPAGQCSHHRLRFA